jgi:hypothetical protein
MSIIGTAFPAVSPVVISPPELPPIQSRLSRLVPDLRTLNMEQYQKISREVLTTLNTTFNMYSDAAWLVQEFTSNPSYTSITLLIRESFLSKLKSRRAWKEVVAKGFNSTAISPWEDGITTSFDFNKFEVNIKEVPDASLTFASGFFSFENFGELLIPLANKMGFKLDHKGLWLEAKRDGKILSEIRVVDNFSEALDLLGMSESNAYRYSSFSTPKGLYEFTASGQYFDKTCYVANADSKPNLLAFIEYINQTSAISNYVFENNSACPWIGTLKRNYPSRVEEYLRVLAEHDAGIRVGQKIGVGIFREVTKLDKEDLKQFMSFYEKSFVSISYMRKFILGSKQATIRQSIEDNFKKWKVLRTAELSKRLKERTQELKKHKLAAKKSMREMRKNQSIYQHGSFKEESKKFNKSVNTLDGNMVLSSLQNLLGNEVLKDKPRKLFDPKTAARLYNDFRTQNYGFVRGNMGTITSTFNPHTTYAMPQLTEGQFLRNF